VLRTDRSSKGVGLVVPTLLTSPVSAIVHDIKGENWEITAGLWTRIGRVLLFDPTNQKLGGRQSRPRVKSSCAGLP
jgi:type IV secretory pathway TraG/TraD family ATPase VirD4